MRLGVAGKGVVPVVLDDQRMSSVDLMPQVLKHDVRPLRFGEAVVEAWKGIVSRLRGLGVVDANGRPVMTQHGVAERWHSGASEEHGRSWERRARNTHRNSKCDALAMFREVEGREGGTGKQRQGPVTSTVLKRDSHAITDDDRLAAVEEGLWELVANAVNDPRVANHIELAAKSCNSPGTRVRQEGPFSGNGWW